MTTAERAKLAAILGMLGSDSAGERDAAALAAARMVQKLGMTWAQVLDAHEGSHVSLDLAEWHRRAQEAAKAQQAYQNVWATNSQDMYQQQYEAHQANLNPYAQSPLEGLWPNV